MTMMHAIANQDLKTIIVVLILMGCVLLLAGRKGKK